MKRYKKETLKALINREIHFYQKYMEAHEAVMEYTDAVLEGRRFGSGKRVDKVQKENPRG